MQVYNEPSSRPGFSLVKHWDKWAPCTTELSSDICVEMIFAFAGLIDSHLTCIRSQRKAAVGFDYVHSSIQPEGDTVSCTLLCCLVCGQVWMSGTDRCCCVCRRVWCVLMSERVLVGLHCHCQTFQLDLFLPHLTFKNKFLL